MACATSKIGFDKENELSCDNYKCFKLLLNSIDENENNGRWILNRRYCKNTGTGSVMICCIKSKKLECVKLLINHCRKYNINFENDCINNNESALMVAMSMEDNEKMIKLLIQNGDLFDLNRSILRFPSYGCPSYDKHFIMQCDYKKYVDVGFDELSKNNSINGIDPTLLDLSGKNIFDKIIERVGTPEWMDHLIQQGKNKLGWNIKQVIGDYRNKKNETLFHVAVRQSSLSCLTYLLKLNLLDDINVTGGENDDSLLNTCILSHMHYDEVTYKSSLNFKVFELLLSQADIDPNVSNKFGYNAFDMCRTCDKPQYLQILNEWKKSK